MNGADRCFGVYIKSLRESTLKLREAHLSSETAPYALLSCGFSVWYGPKVSTFDGFQLWLLVEKAEKEEVRESNRIAGRARKISNFDRLAPKAKIHWAYDVDFYVVCPPCSR